MSLSLALKLTALIINGTAAIAVKLAGFGVDFTPFLVSFGCSIVLWMFEYFYTHHRRDMHIAMAVGCVAYMTFISPGIAVLSYAMVTLNLPLIDTQLAAWDAAMGFDWLGFLAFAGDHSWFSDAMIVAYHSSGPQMLAVLLFLIIYRHFDRLRRFVLAYAWTVFVVVVTAGLLPAAGAYEYYQPSSELKVMSAHAGVWHLEHFNALRAGTFTEFRLGEVEGLVTFPSFHTVLALLMIWCFWPIRWLKWPVVVLNVFVLLGTVLEGGHHLIDMVAGGVIAVAAIALVNRLSGTEPALDGQPAAADAQNGRQLDESYVR